MFIWKWGNRKESDVENCKMGTGLHLPIYYDNSVALTLFEKFNSNDVSKNNACF